ncbi:MAG TPA: urea carboxylase-associated protein [Alphaproteobacteria bacterium]|jgi:uncharacterized protein|nr:urea carboxylase-associated protein [Alphaproteobacteria bacterium]
MPFSTQKSENDYALIPPRSGAAFCLSKGQRLTIMDVKGEQVADLVCYNARDIAEYLSSGRTFDYEETLFLTTGNRFFSNRSNVMFSIIHDDVGRHDFLLTPCSKDTFRIIYGHTDPHHGCLGNLRQALKPYGVESDNIPTTFNVFMNVALDGETGRIAVLPPKSAAGNTLTIQAHMDLVVGLTACSAELSNNGRFKPIAYRID